VTSERPSDRRLVVPFAGPWLAFADRGDCGPGTTRDCNTEKAYNGLLIVDGVVQALGGLTFATGFLSPRVHTYTTTTRVRASPEFRIAPTVGAAGYGLGAIGTF
jgi:hypothetical protein